jgi:L-ascorbate metabolism protein UlaG (beta-lactamase superfamily)
MSSVLAIAAIQAAGTRTLFMVPLGTESLVRQSGTDHTIEFDWWEQFTPCRCALSRHPALVQCVA